MRHAVKDKKRGVNKVTTEMLRAAGNTTVKSIKEIANKVNYMG